MQHYKYNKVTKILRSKNVDETCLEEKQQNLRQNFMGDTYYIIGDILFVEIQKAKRSLY